MLLFGFNISNFMKQVLEFSLYLFTLKGEGSTQEKSNLLVIQRSGKTHLSRWPNHIPFLGTFCLISWMYWVDSDFPISFFVTYISPTCFHALCYDDSFCIGALFGLRSQLFLGSYMWFYLEQFVPCHLLFFSFYLSSVNLAGCLCFFTFLRY